MPWLFVSKNHWTGGCVGPRAGPDIVEKRIYLPQHRMKPKFSSHPVQDVYEEKQQHVSLLWGECRIAAWGELLGAERVLEKQDVYEEKQECVCIHIQEPGYSNVT
jgi:hypothetical protein